MPFTPEPEFSGRPLCIDMVAAAHARVVDDVRALSKLAGRAPAQNACSTWRRRVGLAFIATLAGGRPELCGDKQSFGGRYGKGSADQTNRCV